MNGFEIILPFLRPIEHLILDDSISEIMINGPYRVFIERRGFLQQEKGISLDERALMVAVKNIARRLGDDISESKPICPTSGPGILSASARQRKAKEIIAASGADKEETLAASVASALGTTFRQQSETWLSIMKKRMAAPSTLLNWKNHLDTWIFSTSIRGTLFGDLPLASIKRTAAQELIDAMVAGRLGPKSIQNYFQVVKMVFSSCVNEYGEELYPRNWKKMGLVIPKVNKKKQNRPCYTKEVMNHLANSLTIKPQMRMLFILCGASGLRIGEALGIRIEKILDGGSRIIIDSKAWNGEEHDYLKTPNGEREIDLPDNVAKLLVEFIGNRKSGLLFCTRNGKQLSQSNILTRYLHPALEEVGFPQAGNHAFRRYRDTFLKNLTNCPQGVLDFWLGWGCEGMSGTTTASNMM